jgi:hypothetical protein
MANASERTGYFNGLTSTYFRITDDGRKLFFPWGAMRLGYAIPSDEQYRRLHRQIKIFHVVSLVAIIVAAAVQQVLGVLMIGALSLAFYAAWVRRLVRRLPPSAERLTRQESMITQARMHGPVGLWLLLIIALMLVAAGIGRLIVEPHTWPVALASTAFFGVCRDRRAHDGAAPPRGRRALVSTIGVHCGWVRLTPWAASAQHAAAVEERFAREAGDVAVSGQMSR